MAPRCRVCSKRNRSCAQNCEYRPIFPKSMPKATFQTICDNYGYERFKTLVELWHPLQQKQAIKSLLRESALRTLYPVHGMSMRVMQQQARIRQLKERVDFCDAYHWHLVQQVGHEGQPQQDNVQQFDDFLVDENGEELFDGAALANMVLDLEQNLGYVNNDDIQEEQDLGLMGDQQQH